MKEGEFGSGFGGEGLLVGSEEGEKRQEAGEMKVRRKDQPARKDLVLLDNSRSPMTFSPGPFLPSFVSDSVSKAVSELWRPNGEELGKGEREEKEWRW